MKSEANKKQIGGDHYKVTYEPWDFIHDVGMHYYLGNAVKYIYRWRSKNGVEDLHKAVHYLEKAIEKKVVDCYDGSSRLYGYDYEIQNVPLFTKFVHPLEQDDRNIITTIQNGSCISAITLITTLIQNNTNVTAYTKG